MPAQSLSAMMIITKGLDVKKYSTVQKLTRIINHLDMLNDDLTDVKEKEIIERITERLLLTLRREVGKYMNREDMKRVRIKELNEKLKIYDLKAMKKPVWGRCLMCGHAYEMFLYMPSWRDCPECGEKQCVFPNFIS